MTEEKFTVRTFIKIVVLTVLACIGFFVLWGFIFLFSLPLRNYELSVFLSMLISAITIFALIMVLMPLKRRKYVALSKKQTAGAYVAWAIIFVFSLPLIKIDTLLFLSYLPTLVAILVIIIYHSLRRKRKDMAHFWSE